MADPFDPATTWARLTAAAKQLEGMANARVSITLGSVDELRALAAAAGLPVKEWVSIWDGGPQLVASFEARRGWVEITGVASRAATPAEVEQHQTDIDISNGSRRATPEEIEEALRHG